MRIGVIGRGIVGGATGKAFEPHVDEVRYYDVREQVRTHRLVETIEQSDLIFVCLPTPQVDDSLACDTFIIDQFFNVLRGEGYNDKNYVLRSTVPVGFTRRCREVYKMPNLVHSPEFLTARTAEEDAKNPARMIIGSVSPTDCTTLLAALYQEVFDAGGSRPPIFLMTSDESEFVKLMQNSFSSIKIAAFNEFRCFSDKKGMDWERCLTALLAGGWINPMHTSVPGPDGKLGFGGACLVKDLANMIQCMDDAGVQRLVSTAAYMRNEHIDRKE